MRVKKNQNKKTQAKKKRQRGAALLETALVFTVAVSMILFIVDMGRILLTQQFIAERARVGVRNAVVNNWDATAVANYVVYGVTTAPAGNVQNPTPPGYFGMIPSQVTLTTYPDSGIGDARYKITVQGVQLFTFIPYISGTYHAPNVTATAPVQSQGATN